MTAEAERWRYVLEPLPGIHPRIPAYVQEAGDAMAERLEALSNPEQLARWFHEAYERMAPFYGYRTRKESAVPWEDLPETNRRLMIAVAALIVGGKLEVSS